MGIEVVTLGYIFMEKIKYPEKIVGPILGGSISYTSVALARLGTKVGMVTNIGKEMPKELLTPFAECGIDTTGIHVRKDTPTTANLLSYDEQGVKTIAYLRRAPVIQFADIPSAYLSAAVFCFCPVNYDIGPETVAQVKALGKVTIADFGGLGGAANHQETQDLPRSEVIHKLEAYLKNLDMIKISDEDWLRIFGEKLTDVATAVDYFLAQGVKTVILTLGAKGCVVGTKAGIHKIPAVPTKAVDVTGAGDVFLGAFLAEYIKSQDLTYAATFANATSAILIEKRGGVSLDRIPTREKVLASLKGFNLSDEC